MKQFFLFFAMLFVSSNLIFGQTYSEILGRPTDNSITVSVLFNQQVDFYFEYGTSSGSYGNVTSTTSNTANTPDEIDLQSLSSDTKYFYRTRYRLTGGSGSFLASPEHTFRTQRALGSTFTFTIEADEHLYDHKGDRAEYQVCLANQAADNPDFMISLGDIFGDDHNPFTITSAEVDSLHKDYRQYLGNICHSVPFYVCLGNHEGEMDYYLNQTPPNNLAVYETLWRKFYYPNPYPNGFYTGNTDVESYGMGNPENYYSWTWGNALFVVMDVYRDQCDTSAKPTKWDWTLGLPQYTWLKNTLENSTSQYKFVFAHHVSGQGRGGAVQANLFEWGGHEQNGNYTFATKRPGWAKPIHQLFVDNGVNIFFQGHDHLFAREVKDGVIYQEVPMPSDSSYELGMIANADAYTADTIGGSGHLRVTVSPACVNVDFVQAYLPADTVGGVLHNRNVAFNYSIGTCTTGIVETNTNNLVNIYPNPAKDHLTVVLPQNIGDFTINLINTLGQTILQTPSNSIDVSGIPNGIYFINIKTNKEEMNKKVIINH